MVLNARTFLKIANYSSKTVFQIPLKASLPALKISGSNHIQCKIKKYAIRRRNNVNVYSSHATPNFVIVFWCLLVHGSHTLFCMHIYVQNQVSGVLSL